MPSSRSRFSRRQLLAATAALPAAWLSGACTLSRADRSTGAGSDPGTRAPAEDPDVAILARAVLQVESLVELLERTVSERAGLADVVEPLLASHRRHAVVLGAAGPSGEDRQPTGSPSTPTGSPGGEPTRSPSGTPTEPSGTPPTLPRGRDRLLGLLAEKEQRAADAHLRQVRQVTSGQFAGLLAAISASESQHATVLREAAA